MAWRLYKKSGGRYMFYLKFQGKQYNKVVTTIAEGKAWEVEKKKELKKQADIPPILTFSQACKAYLEDCSARMQPNTFREKQHHLREFAAFLGTNMAFDTISIALAKRYLLVAQAQHGNKSANRRLQNLKALWNWHKETAPANPWRGIPPFTEDETIKYVPPPADVNLVLAQAVPWERRFLQMLLHTGARLSELLNLKWEDVSLEHKTLLLWTRKRRNGSRQSRAVPMDETLFDILKRLREKHPDAEYVFINPVTGRHYARNQPSIKNMLARLCEKAGVRPFGFHAIRHYFALRLMESKKTGLTDIQLLLGHQRATTTDIYLRSMAPRLDYLAEIIEEAVVPKAKK